MKKKTEGAPRKARKPAAKSANKRCKFQKWLTEDGLKLIRSWTRDGLTDQQIADKVGVSRSTLSKWKVDHAEIGEAMRETRELVNADVKNELIRNAVGYAYTEPQFFKLRKVMYKDGKKIAEWEELEERAVTKWHPGDVRAQTFLLTNKDRKNFQYKPEQEVEDAGKIEIVLEDQKDRELCE